MKKTLVILILSCFVLLLTCTKDTVDTNTCFQEDIFPIIVSNCTMSGCHNSTEGEGNYNFTNYDGIMRAVKPRHPLESPLYTIIRGAHPSMPPSGYSVLTHAQVNKIKAWIRIGAPNSSNCRVCDPTNFSYSVRISTIIQTWCTGCHDPANKGGGYDLTTYTGVVNSISGNKLLGSIKHMGSFSPMPKNGGQLSTCDMDAIENWINAGYPDN